MLQPRSRGPSWWRLKSGVPEDVKGRLPFYKDDWVQGFKPGFRQGCPPWSVMSVTGALLSVQANLAQRACFAWHVGLILFQGP